MQLNSNSTFATECQTSLNDFQDVIQSNEMYILKWA